MLHPDAIRLQETLSAFSSEDVGGTPDGGVSRPAASAFDGIARRRFQEHCEALGLAVRVDDIGNMYARREGREPALAPLVIGSHLDTVVPGGRFDGILGVAIALETVALLNDADEQTLRPIEVVNWTGEEGARFPPAMIGSGVVTGEWDAEYAQSRTDLEGLRLGDELRAIGFLGEERHRLTEFFAALEVHIEQGVQLEAADLGVGVVSGIQPVKWITVTLRGRGGHAGGPGPVRPSLALLAAARMIVASREIAESDPENKITVGNITPHPGSNNVIPDVVTVNIDIRSTTDAKVREQFAALTERFRVIAREEEVEIDVEEYWELPAANFDERLREILTETAGDLGIQTRDLIGTIGHDSVFLAQMGPTAMLFTRTTGGRSHAPDEHAPWDAVLETAQVFSNAAHHLANLRELK